MEPGEPLQRLVRRGPEPGGARGGEARRAGAARYGAGRAVGGGAKARAALLGQGRPARPRALSEKAETLGFISTAVYFAVEKMSPGWGIDLLKVTQ